MSHGRSEVSFRNSYSSKIYVAYMRRDWDCLADCGDRWDVLGWINLEPYFVVQEDLRPEEA